MEDDAMRRNPIKLFVSTYEHAQRGPAIGALHHFRALRNDPRFEIFEGRLKAIPRKERKRIDWVWFYNFIDPGDYFFVRKKMKNAKIVIGPNLLFEKGEKGPYTDREHWLINNVTCDIYCQAAEYYMNWVRRFYTKVSRYVEIPYCIDTNEVFQTSPEKDYDVLLYLKVRRIDGRLPELYNHLVHLLNRENIAHHTMKYGTHNRDEFIYKVSQSRCCAWLSIEDFSANAQLECQLLDVPIIGTEYNATHISDPRLLTDAQTFDFDHWVQWRSDMPETYLKKIIWFLSEGNQHTVNSPRQYVIENHSLSVYSDKVWRMMNDNGKSRGTSE